MSLTQRNVDGPGCVVIQFCSGMQLMLCPNENSENKQIMYACINCDYKQLAENSCVYVNKIMHEVHQLAKINADVIGDPTLPRSNNHPCPKCHHQNAVYFQSDSFISEDEIRFYYVCTNVVCKHRWTE